MTAAPTPMRLTRELAALCHRDVEEPVSDPRYDNFTDADYDRAVAHVLGGRPQGPFWLFAYGSLMWKPEFPTVEARRAIARGWKRGFSLRIESYRGTPERPGYMMCLDPGGQCEAKVLRVGEETVEVSLRQLLYREVGCEEALDGVRWIDTETPQGPVRALTSYAQPHRLDIYAENRPLEEVAYGLARACGHWGSGADYLFNTVTHLEELGIHDEGLWRLQDMVAAEIKAIYGVR